jgi:hypothetical protein
MDHSHTFTKFSANDIFHKLEEKADRYAQDVARYESLDVHSKPLLSQITLEYMREGMSRVEAETHAYADDRYKQHVLGAVNAKEISVRSKAAYQNALRWADLKQSEEASARTLVTRN